MKTIRTRLSQWLCALCGGHEDFKVYETHKVYFECLCCHRQTPGWKV